MQYVGARYVPQFYDDGNGGTDWTANTIYEPLTIVTYNSNSYTSRKPVPANIGDPANNPEYWAATGVYNAQVNTLQNDVNALNANAAFEDHTDAMDFSVATIAGIADESSVVHKELHVMNGYVFLKVGLGRQSFNSVGTKICNIGSAYAPIYDQRFAIGFSSGVDWTTNVEHPSAKIGSNGDIFLGGNYTSMVGNLYFSGMWPLKSLY